MAVTKQDCFRAGAAAANNGRSTMGSGNPYKADSWQANAWSDGYRARLKELETPLPASAGYGNMMAAFPDRMPAPTREHIRRLNADALGERCSTRALRLDNSIGRLYNRYA